ncbi:hypothetical protein ACN27F_23325 [Solwaraspora sp. WMMB335]|uniref:hypothetical protein n=1 Tax=Solwaraspora sp. WMMB335 TaxID=3404118 RepID=UPI003B92A886
MTQAAERWSYDDHPADARVVPSVARRNAHPADNSAATAGSGPRDPLVDHLDNLARMPDLSWIEAPGPGTGSDTGVASPDDSPDDRSSAGEIQHRAETDQRDQRESSRAAPDQRFAPEGSWDLRGVEIGTGSWPRLSMPESIAGGDDDRGHRPRHAAPEPPTDALSRQLENALTLPPEPTVRRADPAGQPIVDHLRDLAEHANERPVRRALATLLRGATAGLVDLGAAEAQARESTLVAAARLRQPGPRVIAVVSGNGGSGATATAAGIGVTLAALRDDQSILVDTRSAGTSLAAGLVGRPVPNVVDLIRDPYLPPFVAPGGLRLLDGAPWFDPLGGDLSAVLELLTSQYAFTVLDVGNDTSTTAQSALAAADQLVVVTGDNQRSAEATSVALRRITGRADGVQLQNAVVVVVCTRPTGHARVTRMLRGEIGADVARMVVVPHDRVMAAAGPLRARRLGRRTRHAFLTIAALLGDA